MKRAIFSLITSAVISTQATAQSATETFCGVGHSNEILLTGPVLENPDGYYVSGLKTQLSHGDHRIIEATGTEFYVCTRPASTPDMTVTGAIDASDRREVSYLFAPIRPRPAGANS